MRDARQQLVFRHPELTRLSERAHLCRQWGKLILQRGDSLVKQVQLSTQLRVRMSIPGSKELAIAFANGAKCRAPRVFFSPRLQPLQAMLQVIAPASKEAVQAEHGDSQEIESQAMAVVSRHELATEFTVQAHDQLHEIVG